MTDWLTFSVVVVVGPLDHFAEALPDGCLAPEFVAEFDALLEGLRGGLDVFLQAGRDNATCGGPGNHFFFPFSCILIRRFKCSYIYFQG